MHQDQTDFLNTHSLKFIEMALSTDRIERLADPDGYGKRTGGCGDTAEFFLICKDNILESVSFDVHGRILSRIDGCQMPSIRNTKGLKERTA